MRRMLTLLAFAACVALVALLLLAPLMASAAPARQASHGDWHVYRDGDSCFALTRPSDAVPGALDHGDVSFMVSSWRGGPRSQPSFRAGYRLAPLRAPRVEIASRAFRAYADGNEAFLRDDVEGALVDAMRGGANMRVEAHTEDGQMAVYEFSLMGLTAALRQVDQLC